MSETPDTSDGIVTNRRDLLKTTGLAMATVGGASGVSFAAPTPENLSTIKLRGTPTKPVRGEVINRKRASALKKLRRTGDLADDVVLKQFDDEESDILSYNFVVASDGSVEEHVYRYSPEGGLSVSSVGTDPASRAHAAADEWLAEGTPGTQSSATTQDTVSTTASYPDWYNWNSAGSTYDVNERPPYGVVIEDYDFRSDPNGSDAMAVQTGVDMEAGYNREKNGYDEYDQWHMKMAFARHEWLKPTVGDSDMRDRYPRGDLSEGTESYGVSLGIDGQGTGSIGVSYGFSKSMDNIIDESSQGDNVGRWRMKLDPYSDAAQSNAFYNPGSMALVDNESCGSDSWDVPAVDIPLDVEFGMPWYNTWSDTHTESFSDSFIVNCY